MWIDSSHSSNIACVYMNGWHPIVPQSTALANSSIGRPVDVDEGRRVDEGVLVERTYKDVAHQYQQSTPPFGPLSPSPLKTLVPWVPHAHGIHM